MLRHPNPEIRIMPMAPPGAVAMAQMGDDNSEFNVIIVFTVIFCRELPLSNRQ